MNRDQFWQEATEIVCLEGGFKLLPGSSMTEYTYPLAPRNNRVSAMIMYADGQNNVYSFGSRNALRWEDVRDHLREKVAEKAAQIEEARLAAIARYAPPCQATLTGHVPQ